MTALGSHRFMYVDASRGMEIRTAVTLRDLLTDLMINSGEEIAYWVEGAGRDAAEAWRKNKREDAARTITLENYPAIFKAFLRIDYANGAVNRLEPEPASYVVPREWLPQLGDCDARLAGLTEEELDTFCDGDHDEALALIAARPELQLASELLNGYFNGWEA